jgi:hypothetical protein
LSCFGEAGGGFLKPLIIHRQGNVFLGNNGLTAETLPVEFQKDFPDVSPKYIDHLSLLAGIAAGRALKGMAGGLDAHTRRNFAVVAGSALASMESVVDFDSQALLKGPNTVNPMDFPNTVANAAGSRIGIWFQLKGPNVTLTNGCTSFLDAIGFAWEGYNSGLFQTCLVGAVEKVPAFLKPVAAPPSSAMTFKEGAIFLLASGDGSQGALFEVVDYFTLQLKLDLSLPRGFQKRFDLLWNEAQWLGAPESSLLESHFPTGLIRYSPNPALLELGLGGADSLDHFLSSPSSCGVIAAVSKMERKISFIKIKK